MKQQLLFIVLVVIVLLSCADRGIITDINLDSVAYGEVIEKNYYPAHDDQEYQYDYTAEKMVLKTVHHSAVYEIDINQFDAFSNKNYFATRHINSTDYYSLKIGDIYGDTDKAKTYTLSVINEKKNRGFRSFKYYQIDKFKIGDFVIFDEVAK